MPKVLKFIGLDPKARYTVQKVWPEVLDEYSPSVMQKADGRIIQCRATHETRYAAADYDATNQYSI